MSDTHKYQSSKTDARTLQILEPDIKDPGGFSVRRVLPVPSRCVVGPFIFFDHYGPMELPPGEGVQVRPHPHIGLSTVSYLFEGEIIHRDSLGYVQAIQAQAVNLMTAGQGIVHSERSEEGLDRVSSLQGIQAWMALPRKLQECDPDFPHYPASSLPGFEQAKQDWRENRFDPVPGETEFIPLPVS